MAGGAREEFRWAIVGVAWGAVRSDPYWKAQYKRLTKTKHPNQAIVAIARRLVVAVWHILTKREPYHHADEDTLASAVKNTRAEESRENKGQKRK